MGSAAAPQVATEFFSLSCSHCAAFAREALPELKAKWIAPGRLRWIYHDFPTDLAALEAAVVARCLPPERYDCFIEVLFAAQDRWAFGTGDVTDALWKLAGEAGMNRTTFDQAVADKELRDWVVGQETEAEQRWHVTATPSFVIKDKLYTGAMSASEFATILGS